MRRRVNLILLLVPIVCVGLLVPSLTARADDPPAKRNNLVKPAQPTPPPAPPRAEPSHVEPQRRDDPPAQRASRNDAPRNNLVRPSSARIFARDDTDDPPPARAPRARVANIQPRARGLAPSSLDTPLPPPINNLVKPAPRQDRRDWSDDRRNERWYRDRGFDHRYFGGYGRGGFPYGSSWYGGGSNWYGGGSGWYGGGASGSGCDPFTAGSYSYYDERSDPWASTRDGLRWYGRGSEWDDWGTRWYGYRSPGGVRLWDINPGSRIGWWDPCEIECFDSRTDTVYIASLPQSSYVRAWPIAPDLDVDFNADGEPAPRFVDAPTTSAALERHLSFHAARLTPRVLAAADHAKNGRFDLAIGLLRRAVLASPESFAATALLDSLGQVPQQVQDVKYALAVLREPPQRVVRVQDAAFMTAALHGALGEGREARAGVDRAQSLGDNDPSTKALALALQRTIDVR